MPPQIHIILAKTHNILLEHLPLANSSSPSNLLGLDIYPLTSFDTIINHIKTKVMVLQIIWGNSHPC